MEYKDYYKTLGVPRTATPAEVKKSYRRLARELHPDRNPGDKTAETRFKEVNEAHEVLADPAKRQQYDVLGANWERYTRAGAGAPGGAGAGSPFAGNPFGPNGPFAAYAQGAGRDGNIHYEFHGADAESFSDFFRTFFGGAAAGPEPSARPARSASGTRTAGGTAGRSANPDRSGGARSGQGATSTATGGKTGGDRRSGNPFEELVSRLRSDGVDAAEPGDGRAGRPGARRGDIEVGVDVTLEEAFRGSARLVQVGDRRLEVRLPAGVDTGSKIRLRGKAGAGDKAGDLYLITKVGPHPVFTRNGADLSRELPISLSEALLGGEVDVETLRGRVLLKIPAGTQQGQIFRLAGRGMPRLRGEGAGDLYVRTKVVLPGKLEGKQRKTAEDLLRQIDQPNPRKT